MNKPHDPLFRIGMLFVLLTCLYFAARSFPTLF